MDLLIFGGQSNMQGQTEAFPGACTVEGASEYRFLTNSFQALQHPVGEDIGADLLLGAHEGHGSLVPDFVRAYRVVRRAEVTSVHVAKGSTTISDWDPSGERFLTAVKKMQACRRALKEAPAHTYYIWLQGESDAMAGTGEEEYLCKLKAFKEAVKAEMGAERFCIIRVGYFSHCYLGDSDARDEAIMAAQERAAREDGDFCILTRIAAWLSKDERFLNPQAVGHYNNAGMAMLGAAAGEALGKLAK